LVESLLDGLSTQRIEIDMIEFSGIEFRHVDNRLMSMKLVELGLSGAAMFGPRGDVVQPSEILHDKHVLLERGSFRPVCHAHLDMLRSGRERLRAEIERDNSSSEIVEVAELTLRNLRGDRHEVDRADFLSRADMLGAVGKTVLISDYVDFHSLSSYVSRYTRKRSGMVMGAGSLSELFDERAAARLAGGILEALGRLLQNELALYIYPLLDPKTRNLLTADTFDAGERLRGVYQALIARGAIQRLDNYNPEYLPIFSRDALDKIRKGDSSWESMVPPEVAAVIRDTRALGYRPAQQRSAA
jgi:hypothetical protein